MNFLPGWFPAAVAAQGGLAFPVVEATNTSKEDNATTSHTVSLPASIAAGELLLVLFANSGGSVSTPSGWSALFSTGVGSGSTATTLSCFYKTATGSEGATVTVTTSGANNSGHNSYRISGAQATPEASTTGSDTGGTTADPPSLSPSWVSTKTLWLAVAGTRLNSATHTVSSYPTNFTDGISASGVIPIILTSMRCSSARREDEVSSEDPGVFTLSTSVTSWMAATIGIRPA